ncbi:hypothetical protein ABLU95_11035 [Klebsiella sp. GG_Kp146]|uniref:hypothetical protein n=1 Tax=Klebsiella sp. GG_Kp146 TaxID=3153457 RepID=UPI0032B384C0
MKKYTEFDRKIMEKIGVTPITFHLLFSHDDIPVECKKIAMKEGKSEPFRILDRRLQALRKAGEIRSTSKGWVRA